MLNREGVCWKVNMRASLPMQKGRFQANPRPLTQIGKRRARIRHLGTLGFGLIRRREDCLRSPRNATQIFSARPSQIPALLRMTK
jgi:hypothetical protein